MVLWCFVLNPHRRSPNPNSQLELQDKLRMSSVFFLSTEAGPTGVVKTHLLAKVNYSQRKCQLLVPEPALYRLSRLFTVPCCCVPDLVAAMGRGENAVARAGAAAQGKDSLQHRVGRLRVIAVAIAELRESVNPRYEGVEDTGDGLGFEGLRLEIGG